MTKVVASVLLILVFFAHASPAAATQNYDKSTAKRTAKFGDLVVRVTGMVSTESAPHKGDRHKVAVFVSASNMGKGAVCASLGASLQATFGLEFVGFGGPRLGDPPFPEAPQIYQLLPGQGADGSYVFDVKDGVAPLRLVLKLSNRTIRCGPPWADTFAPGEVRLDVRNLPAPNILLLRQHGQLIVHLLRLCPSTGHRSQMECFRVADHSRGTPGRLWLADRALHRDADTEIRSGDFKKRDRC